MQLEQLKGDLQGDGRLRINWEANRRHAGAKSKDGTHAESRPLEFYSLKAPSPQINIFPVP